MVIRSKMMLTEIRKVSYNSDVRVFVFTTQYDSSIPEDQRFLKASPSGRFEITVDNPSVVDEWKLGQSYYFDAALVEPKPAG